MTLAVALPFHVYGHVDRRALSAGQRIGFEPCVWFGMTLPPNRAAGLTVMLECGAVYRQVPPQAFAFEAGAEPRWSAEQAQAWDCFGGEAQVLEYPYLRELPVRVIASGLTGLYVATLEFGLDGFSREPGQSKCLHLLRLDNGRLTMQPNNNLRWHEASFTDAAGDPSWLRRQSRANRAEGWPPRIAAEARGRRRR